MHQGLNTLSAASRCANEQRWGWGGLSHRPTVLCGSIHAEIERESTPRACEIKSEVGARTGAHILLHVQDMWLSIVRVFSREGSYRAVTACIRAKRGVGVSASCTLAAPGRTKRWGY